MPTDFTKRFLLPGFANSQIEEVQASVGHIHLNCLRESLKCSAPKRQTGVILSIANGVSLVESDLTAIRCTQWTQVAARPLHFHLLYPKHPAGAQMALL